MEKTPIIDWDKAFAEIDEKTNALDRYLWFGHPYAAPDWQAQFNTIVMIYRRMQQIGAPALENENWTDEVSYNESLANAELRDIRRMFWSWRKGPLGSRQGLPATWECSSRAAEYVRGCEAAHCAIAQASDDPEQVLRIFWTLGELSRCSSPGVGIFALAAKKLKTWSPQISESSDSDEGAEY